MNRFSFLVSRLLFLVFRLPRQGQVLVGFTYGLNLIFFGNTFMRNILLIIFLVVVSTSCNSKAAKFDKETYEEHKKNIQQKEKTEPLAFLSVTADDKKNLTGKMVVTCTITNNAAITAYKNIRLKMLCYNENKRAEEHEDVIKNVIFPPTSMKAKLKYRLPKGTGSIEVSVMSAAIAVKANTKP